MIFTGDPNCAHRTSIGMDGCDNRICLRCGAIWHEATWWPATAADSFLSAVLNGPKFWPRSPRRFLVLSDGVIYGAVEVVERAA